MLMLNAEDDRRLHAAQAAVTGGMSTAAMGLAALDWQLHFANAPGQRAQMARRALASAGSVAAYLAAAATGQAATPPLTPRHDDRRFAAPGWQSLPFEAWAQGFLWAEQTAASMADIPGVSPHHRDLVRFAGRQMLDMMSPSNLPWMNPEVIARTVATGGLNLWQGAFHLAQDATRALTGAPPPGAEEFRPGTAVAITPGKVVYRNHLIELIQYSPTTATVRPEPVLFVPAWIMKYYILDLSPANSMVRWLVDQGFTVFMISWKNPGPEDHDLGMADYAQDGVLAAMQAVRAICGDPPLHAVGYCIGGTLLSLVAALMGKRGQDWLASVTLFAAQMDFSESGELSLFIDDSQLAVLDDMMAERGYLKAGQMAAAFKMLRSQDLIWSRIVHDYLMGEPRTMNDLMAWNADTTRMPGRMHSEYLHDLFLKNDFAGGRYRLDDTAIAPADITVPIFQVGTESDHVAPWHSVFKVGMLADADVTFVLTNGGHNAGILSEPGHAHRRYCIGTHLHGAAHAGPDEWLAGHAPQDGSWWPAWAAWLGARSGKPGAPPPMGNATAGYPVIGEAPGDYVLMR